MKTIDLRLGNLALNSSNETVIVLEISETLVKTTPDDIHLISELKPMILTDDILVKLGFTKDNTNGTIWKDLQTHYLELRYADGYYYPNYCQYGEMSSESEQRVAMNRISSLHELQNLFYALTGTELEINL